MRTTLSFISFRRPRRSLLTQGVRAGSWTKVSSNLELGQVAVDWRILQGQACKLIKTVLQARIPVEIVHRDLRSATPYLGVTDGRRILPVDTNRKGTWPGNVRAMKAAKPAIAPSRGLARCSFARPAPLFCCKR